MQLPGRRLYLRALGEGRDRFIICWFSPACTVKIVFREYSEVELAVTAANRIHPPVYFTRLMDTWLPGLAFQKEWKENKSQRSLILSLPWPPPASCWALSHTSCCRSDLSSPRRGCATRCPSTQCGLSSQELPPRRRQRGQTCLTAPRGDSPSDHSFCKGRFLTAFHTQMRSRGKV